MKLSEFAEKALVFDLQSPVSKVISKMVEERRNEVLVFDGKSYKGLISSDKLIRKNIADPDKAKLSSLKSMIDRLEPFGENASFEDVSKSMLVNNYKSVPIYVDGGIKVLTKMSMLAAFPQNLLKNKKAYDVMVFPDAISPNDSIATARSIARDAHANRVVVIDGFGSVSAVLDPIDFLSTTQTKIRSKKGERRGEKLNLGDMLASSTVKPKDLIRVDEDTKLTEVLSEMLKKGKDMIIVEKNRKLSGIITPRHILKLVSSEVSGVYVQITGIQDEDDFIKSLVDSEISNELRSIARSVHIDYLTMHVDKYHRTGSRAKYSVHIKLITSIGMFFAKDDAWDLTQAVRGTLDKIKREVEKKKGKLNAVDKSYKRHR